LIVVLDVYKCFNPSAEAELFCADFGRLQICRQIALRYKNCKKCFVPIPGKAQTRNRINGFIAAKKEPISISSSMAARQTSSE
jgi:hypothetical protein